MATSNQEIEREVDDGSIRAEDISGQGGPRNLWMTRSSMERNLVIAKFMERAAVFQRASTLGDFEASPTIWYDLLQEIICDWHPNDSLGPDVPLCDQNRVDIKTLYDDFLKRQDGKFLLCRTISEAGNGARLEVVVEDPSGKNTAILQLKNFTPAKYSLSVTEGAFEDGDTWFDLLPQGSYIAVKNTFASAAGVIEIGMDAAVTVCCSNPADVVLLSPNKIKALLPGLVWEGPDLEVSFWSGAGDTDAEVMKTLKENGNKAFVRKRYTDALRWYDLSMEYAVGEDHLINIWSNKAAAFHGLGCFLKALEFCDQVLHSDSKHVKAIFRKVKALIGLGRSGEATKFLKGKLTSEQSLMQNKDLQGLGQKIPQFDHPEICNKRMHLTKQEGDKLKGSKATEQDFEPEHVGSIECRPASSTTCRGVFATEDIPLGHLIALHRCFAHVVDSKNDTMHKGLIKDELIGIIANKVAFSPDLGQDIYKLWDGNELKFLDETDVSLNLKVDMARIRKIVEKNVALDVDGCDAGSGYVSTIGAQINHSCVDTNVDGNYDNACFNLRASKLIKRGEQLVIHWCKPVEKLEARKSSLLTYGFTCDCRLCQYEGQRDAETLNEFYGLRAEMESLHKKYPKEEDFLDPTSLRSRQRLADAEILVDSGLQLIGKAEQMFTDAPDLNMMLVDPSVVTLMCSALFDLKRYQELVDLCRKIFPVAEAVGDSYIAVDVARYAMRGYLRLNMKAHTLEWLEKLKKWSTAGRVSIIWDDKHILQMRNIGIDVSDLLKD